MKISNILLLVPLMAGTLWAQRPWQRITVPPVGEVAANFKKPPREYGAIQPWIGWNGAHARESIIQDFDRMTANGIFVANISVARGGNPAYLSPEYLLLMKFAVEEAARQAAEAVRGGGGPHFLEMRTYRFRAHSMYDPDRYREKPEVEGWKERDPIPALVARLSDSGVLAEGDLDRMESEIASEVDDAVAFADAGTFEPLEDLERFVTSETTSGSVVP